jgi:hypothetical protein
MVVPDVVKPFGADGKRFQTRVQPQKNFHGDVINGVGTRRFSQSSDAIPRPTQFPRTRRPRCRSLSHAALCRGGNRRGRGQRSSRASGGAQRSVRHCRSRGPSREESRSKRGLPGPRRGAMRSRRGEREARASRCPSPPRIGQGGVVCRVRMRSFSLTRQEGATACWICGAYGLAGQRPSLLCSWHSSRKSPTRSVDAHRLPSPKLMLERQSRDGRHRIDSKVSDVYKRTTMGRGERLMRKV